ncbi:hypothetical protein G6011_10209 [Alternaria panax]|uniref:Pentatricopeptide repeat-containing protein n=1 Tax=Alternaria panax TaxID=48097 RepID=A0AAD4IBH4_9PLEO|nr:hypothetical protein G6011_10209 [Alternaria panax]
MLGAYVCRQCRIRLSRRIAPVRSPQWQPRATIVSLVGRKPNDNAEPPRGEASALPRDEEDSIQEQADRSGPNTTFSSSLRAGQPRTRYSKLIYDETDSAPTYTGGEEERAFDEAEQNRPVQVERAHADPVLDALHNGRINGAWESFESIYTARDCKALVEPTERDALLLSKERVFLHLLRAVTSAFCAGRTQLTVTPTKVLFRYQQLGIARPEYWVKPAIAHLTFDIIQAVNSPSGPKQDLHALLQELLSLWRLFFQCMGPRNGSMESISTEWNVPPVEAIPDMHDSRQFNMRLQGFIPNYVASPALAFCAIYFYNISDALDPATRKQAAPFLVFLERLLAGSFVDSIFIYTESPDFKALPEDVKIQVIREINAVPGKAMMAIGKSGQTLGPDNTGDAYSNLEAFLMGKIARAVKTKASAAALDGIWNEIEKEYTAKNQIANIPPSIYNAFLSGYMTVLHPQRSVEVWNHMIAHNVKPNMHSWVALLEGCAEARDLDGLNAMWQRMLDTGLEPSNYAWTTRINGLVSLKQINKAFIALDDMARRWIAAENAIKTAQKPIKGQKGLRNPSLSKAVNTCTKPSIEVINGALSAIVQFRPEAMRHEKKVDFVQKLLTWSKNFQIKPDAITYNSLVKLYLNAGDKSTAFRILSQMERDGLEGDAATHAMLISATFDNQIFDNLSEAQQTSRILKIFDELEANGIKMNDYMYSTAIDRLLKKYANHAAMRAVLEHMASRKLVPSVHVYTSIITHYFFQSDPPNISGVDDIVLRLFSTPRMPSDSVLFDRLLEGYASFGEVGKMMSVLTRMSKRQHLPGWSAMIAVVRALARDGDFDRARAIVRDVARGEGVARGGILGDRRGEDMFTRVVEELGFGEEMIGGRMIGEGRGGVAGLERTMMGQQSGGLQYEMESGRAR